MEIAENTQKTEIKKKGRGGKRPGAGRKPILGLNERNFPADVVAQCKDNPDLTPLEYMLSVMRNPKNDRVRRDRMAIAAAPYVHGKIMDKYVGKKETQEEESKTAAETWMRNIVPFDRAS